MNNGKILHLVKEIINLIKAEKKQAELDKLAANELNYGILRDLIKSASFGVKIEVTLRDGTKLIIDRDDPLKKLPQVNLEGF